jgi:hypothetical protein
VLRCLHGEDACVEDLPPWEPDDDALIDLDDLPPDDPLWAEFLTQALSLAQPFALSP